MSEEYLLTDFQQCTAERIVKVFCNGQQRVLLADEVGLGKTIVAREVVKRLSRQHREEEHKERFRVIYICSNLSIASQNVRKLGIRSQMNVAESRLSMQHLKLYEADQASGDDEQLIPLTPATSFSMTSGYGIQEERALMLIHLRRLPVFVGYEEKLSRFLVCNAGKNWQSIINCYEGKACNLAKAGSSYLENMSRALTDKLAEHPELVPEIKSLCDSFGPEQGIKQHTLVRRLRMLFAEISLSMLEPDLVIMDEFQRFRDMIAPASDCEENLLSQQFLHGTGTRVLLLSATPYKPYSTLEEIADDESSDHYREFMDVMNFLFSGDGQQKSFQRIWRSYSSALCEMSSGTMTALIARKEQAEQMLYQGICRTERFNTGIIDDSGVKDVPISEGDVRSYHAMQKLLDQIAQQNTRTMHWRTVPVDYVKSAPYLLSFMEKYQLKRQIRDWCLTHPEYAMGMRDDVDYLLLKKTAIQHYRRLPSHNARLDALKKLVFDEDGYGPETLLWIPPSRPYYRAKGVFERNRAFSKVLVFSAWEMVPRMISIMLSYESERLTIGRLCHSAKKPRERGYFASREERRFGIGRLKREWEEIICLVSPTLADLYCPEEWLGSDLDTLLRELKKRLKPRVVDLRMKWNIKENQKAGAGDLAECIRALDGDPSACPSQMPKNAEQLMVEMAIGSPAICCYRMLLRNCEKASEQCAGYAREIAKHVFVSLFNKAESAAVLDLIYQQAQDENVYYQNVFRYCCQGNLQAVLDEFAHVLNVRGKALKSAVIESVADTVSLPIDTQESFPSHERVNMRSHFAVGYYNAKVNDDEKVARIDRKR